MELSVDLAYIIQNSLETLEDDSPEQSCMDTGNLHMTIENNQEAVNMKHLRVILSALCGAMLFIGQITLATAAETNTKQLDEDQLTHKDCLGCHVSVILGIVKQHLDSPHVNLKVDEEVRCHDCHGEGHKTMDDFAEAEMPTADTCGECHKKKLKEHR